MKKALIAGGAGFIGSHLCRKLLKQYYDVICVDNLLTGNKDNIKDLSSQKNFTFVELDIIKDISSLEKFGTIDYIFHLASPASPNKESKTSYINYPIETLLVNSTGTYHLLELARKNNSTFLFASTSEVYGDPQISPQVETYFGNVNPNGVRSVYDEAKRFGEAITFAYLRKFYIDVRIVRIFNTYGPYMQKDDGRVVSNFITQALAQSPMTIYGEGLQTRSFCYVSDLVEGLLSAMITSGTKGEVINLGNPDERTVEELATIIKEMTATQSEIIFKQLPQDDPKKRCPDITKAQKLLSWKPKVSLQDGLKATIDYFKTV